MSVPSGKTYDSDTFAADTGWTKTTSSGTYTVSGGKGNFTAGGGGLNSLGLVRTVGTVSQPYMKYSMDFNAASGTDHSFIISLSTSSSFAFASTFGAYVNGGGVLYAYDSGAVDVGFGAITTQTYNVAVVILPNRSAKLYIDGVEKYQSVNFAGTLITNNLLYWQVHVDRVNGVGGLLQVDNFLIKDQAAIEIERSIAGGGAGFTQIATVDFGTQSFHDTNALAKRTQYYYRVRSNRGGDTSPYSSEFTTTTLAAPEDYYIKEYFR